MKVDVKAINFNLDIIDTAVRYIREEVNGGTAPDYPIPDDQLEFENGNVWKPKSESDGNLVVILRNDWALPDMVKVQLKNGMWLGMRYTGSDHNGNRHHYRGGYPGGANYAGARQGGGVRIYYKNEFKVIPLPGPPRGRYE